MRVVELGWQARRIAVNQLIRFINIETQNPILNPCHEPCHLARPWDNQLPCSAGLLGGVAPPFPPKVLGMRDRVDTSSHPPLFLVANSVERAVVSRTKRHGPFVTYLAAHGPQLGKTYVMGMAR